MSNFTPKEDFWLDDEYMYKHLREIFGDQDKELYWLANKRLVLKQNLIA